MGMIAEYSHAMQQLRCFLLRHAHVHSCTEKLLRKTAIVTVLHADCHLIRIVQSKNDLARSLMWQLTTETLLPSVEH